MTPQATKLAFVALTFFAAAHAQTTASCPSSNNTIFTTPSGAQFAIECGTDRTGGDLSWSAEPNFTACIELCASTAKCIDVTYSGTACYLKSTLMAPHSCGAFGARLIVSGSSSSSSSAASTTTKVSSTSITSTSSSASAVATLSCPSSNATVFTSGDSSFVVECNSDRVGGDLSWVYASGLDDCIVACVGTAGCIDVSWVVGKPGECYMKKSIVPAVSATNVWGARSLVSSSTSSVNSVKTSTSTSPSVVVSSTVKTSSSTASVTIASSTKVSSSTTSTVTSSLVKSSTTTSVSTPISTSGCGKSLPSGMTAGGASQSLNITTLDGLIRSYLLYIPSTYTTTAKTPLVFAFHGSGSTSAGQEAITGFSTTSINPNNIVVYPQGVADHWQGAPYATVGVDDVAFTTQLLAFLSSELCIDPDRSYASGHSNGGGFTGTLACDSTASTIFAAFGASSGAFYPNVSSAVSCDADTVPITCTPGRTQIPFLEVHGNADPQISYTGGSHDGECLPSIPHYITEYSIREGYGSANVSTALTGGNVKYTFGSTVVHYMINGLGHTWATDVNGFSTSPTMLAFFEQWSL